MDEVKVKLYGSFSSSCSMVHHALKLKGVVYEYLDEDLEMSPVTEKLPALVVDGKAIAGSPAILEFVEEMWKEKDPHLLPSNLFKRAKVRFWADFIHQKLVPACNTIMNCGGEVQQKAIKEFKEHLSTLEDGIKQQFCCRGRFIGGERPGLLDVIIGSCYVWFKVAGEIAGVELMEKERVPLLCSCMAAYAELEVVKGMMTPRIELLARALGMRKRALLASGVY